MVLVPIFSQWWYSRGGTFSTSAERIIVLAHSHLRDLGGCGARGRAAGVLGARGEVTAAPRATSEELQYSDAR